MDKLKVGDKVVAIKSLGPVRFGPFVLRAWYRKGAKGVVMHTESRFGQDAVYVKFKSGRFAKTPPQSADMAAFRSARIGTEHEDDAWFGPAEHFVKE